MLQELESPDHPSADYAIHNKGTRAASKPADVEKRSVDLGFSGPNRYDVEIAIRIRKVIVRGRRDQLITHRQCAGYDLKRSGCSQWISSDAFDRANGNRIRSFSEYLFDKLNLRCVQQRISQPVSRYVIDLVLCALRICKSKFHRIPQSSAIVGRIGIPLRAVTCDLKINTRTSCLCSLKIFQDEHSSTFC